PICARSLLRAPNPRGRRRRPSLPDGKAHLSMWHDACTPAPMVRARKLRHNRNHADNKATVSSGSAVSDNRATGGIIVMKFTRVAAGATVVLAALTTSGLIAGPAGADPTNAKKGQVFDMTCEGLGTVEIATN